MSQTEVVAVKGGAIQAQNDEEQTEVAQAREIVNVWALVIHPRIPSVIDHFAEFERGIVNKIVGWCATTQQAQAGFNQLANCNRRLNIVWRAKVRKQAHSMLAASSRMLQQAVRLYPQMRQFQPGVHMRLCNAGLLLADSREIMGMEFDDVDAPAEEEEEVAPGGLHMGAMRLQRPTHARAAMGPREGGGHGWYTPYRGGWRPPSRRCPSSTSLWMASHSCSCA